MTRKDGGDSRKNLVHAGVGCYSNIVTEGIGIIANILFQRVTLPRETKWAQTPCVKLKKHSNMSCWSLVTSVHRHN